MLKDGDLVVFNSRSGELFVVKNVKRITFEFDHQFGGIGKAKKESVVKWYSLDDNGNYILKDIKDI